MKRGKFITLEGGEGAGKSTQLRRLSDFLQGQGIEVVATREVGGTPSAEAIRDLWLKPAEGHWDAVSELLLIMAARREHLVKKIWPALDKGAWVVSDRFIDSTRAYQGVGLGMGMEVVDDFYRYIAPAFEPDLTLLLDLPVETGLARMAARKGPDDRYQQKDAGFHQKLRDAYLDIAQKNVARFRIIDAAREPGPVAASIEQALRGQFGL